MCKLEYIRRIRFRQYFYCEEKTLNYNLKVQLKNLQELIEYIDSLIADDKLIPKEPNPAQVNFSFR